MNREIVAHMLTTRLARIIAHERNVYHFMTTEPVDMVSIERERRMHQAFEPAIEAFERLLQLAEQYNSSSRKVQQLAKFLGAVSGYLPEISLNWLFDQDVKVGDDMLTILGGVRWGGNLNPEMIADGQRRIPAMLEEWIVNRP